MKLNRVPTSPSGGRIDSRRILPPSSRPSKASLHVCNTLATDMNTVGTAASPTVSDAARQCAFSTVKQETMVEKQVMDVEGTVPSWLEGSFIRNGPGVYHPFKHLFDGYAMLAKTRFSGGKMFAGYRFVDTNAYRAFKEDGKPRWREFATPVQYDSEAEGLFKEVLKTIGSAMGVTTNVTDNAGVCVVPHGKGRALAVTETVVGTYVIDTDTLETVEQAKYKDGLKGDLTTAHYGRDDEGNLINFTSEIGGGFNVFSQKPGTLDRKLIARVPHRYPQAPAWIHSFPCSLKHAVLPEMPIYFDLQSLVTGVDADYVFTKWRPEDGTRIHLVPTVGPLKGRVCTFTAPTFFSFHQVNCYEDDERGVLVVDLSVYDDGPAIVNHLTLENIQGPVERSGIVSSAGLRRIEIPLAPLRAGKVEGGSIAGPRDIVSQESLGGFFEFAVINPAFYGRKNRFCWGVCARQPTNVGNTLCKVDLETGEVKQWFLEGGIPGEPVFVARPGATAEDDGMIVSLIAGGDGKGKVAVIDARTFETVSLGKLTHEVPYGFHGGWFPSN